MWDFSRLLLWPRTRKLSIPQPWPISCFSPLFSVTASVQSSRWEASNFHFPASQTQSLVLAWAHQQAMCLINRKLNCVPLSGLFATSLLLLMTLGPSSVALYRQGWTQKSWVLLMLFWFWLSLRWVTEILWSRWEKPTVFPLPTLKLSGDIFFGGFIGVWIINFQELPNSSCRGFWAFLFPL